MTDYSQFITFNYDGELFKTRDYIIKGNSQFQKFYTIDLNNQHEKLSNKNTKILGQKLAYVAYLYTYPIV